MKKKLLIVPDDETLKKVLREDFLSYIKDDHFSGSMLVVRNSKVLFKESYGMADYEKNISNSSATSFRIASLSKQFTAACILLLQERGLVNVADKISKYLADYQNGDKITIYDLLTHTSGIEEYTTEDFMQNAKNFYSPSQLTDLFKDKPLKFEPGSKFEYTNSNYVLLGMIIEKVSGSSFEDFLNNNILSPLDLKNTGIEHDETGDNRALGYKFDNFKFQKTSYIDMSAAFAAGSMYSTIDDLYKWDQALYTNKLLKKESLNKYFTPNEFGYAYGWFILDENNNPMLHGGGVNGFKSFIFRDTQLKELVLILCNNETFDWENFHKILNTVTGIKYKF